MKIGRLGAKLAHPVERLPLEARVADGERFVDEQYVRVHVDRDREGESAVHARRVRSHRQVDEVADFGELGDGVVLLGDLGAREAGGETAQHDVLPAGEVLVEAHAEREERAHRAAYLDSPSLGEGSPRASA